MAREHEIKKLNFQISGYSNQEIEQLIHEIIPEIIETYFDKFDIFDKEIFIDKIEFDLGTIKSSNFVEEIEVRLAYLLQTEFQKFFSQPNIENQIREKAFVTRTDAFINYIKKGYSDFDDQNLNELFQHLLTTDIALLRELLSQVQDSPESMHRIFYQVSYKNLEKYWFKVYPKAYKQIRSIVDVIISDAGQNWNPELSSEGIDQFLKKMMFGFMIKPLENEKIGIGFVELLKTNVDGFKSYEHDFKTSAFQYLNKLTDRIERSGIGVNSRGSFKQSSDSMAGGSEEKSLETEILDFVIKGQGTPEAVLQKLKERKIQNWQFIIEQLSVKARNEDLPFQRFNSILSDQQFLLLLNQIKKTGRNYQIQNARGLDYLRVLLKELLSEDIYLSNQTKLGKYVLNSSTDGKDLKELVADYIEIYSAKKHLKSTEIIQLIQKRTENALHKEAKSIQKITEQIKKEIKLGEEPASRISKDPLSAFIHFLKHGVWALENISPHEILIELLEASKEHLIIELRRHLKIKTVWLRLIYQHPLEKVKLIFQQVFDDKKDFQLLSKKLDHLKEGELNILHQRKLLEAFINAKVLAADDEDVSFEILFLKLVDDLGTDTKSFSRHNDFETNENINQLLTEFLKNAKGKTKPNNLQKTVIIQALFANPHYLVNYFFDQKITLAHWDYFLKSFNKNELPDLLKVFSSFRVNEVRWMASFIKFFNINKLEKILSKPVLLELILFLIPNTEEEQSGFLSLLYKELDRKDKKLSKALSKHLPVVKLTQSSYLFKNSTDFPKSLNIVGLEKGLEEFETLFHKMNSAGVNLTAVQFNQILINVLPFSNSTSALKNYFFTNLIDTYPQFEKAIQSVADTVKIGKVQGATTQTEIIEFKSFALLIQQIVATGEFIYKPYFDDQNKFEKYFLTALDYSEELIKVVSLSDPAKIVVFLKQFSNANLHSLDELIQNRYLSQELLDIRKEFLAKYPEFHQTIIFHSIAFSLSARRNLASDFLQFMDENIEGIQLSAIAIIAKVESVPIDIFPKVYVEAIIHYLKYGKHIYMPLELDGVESAINKIFSYWPEELVFQLGREQKPSQILEKLFDSISANRQISMFSLLMSLDTSKVEYIVKEVNKTTKVDLKKIFSSWISFSFANTQLRSNRELIEVLIATFRLDNKNKKPTLSNAELEEIDWKIGLNDPLPSVLIKQEFDQSKAKQHYTLKLLIKEIVIQGRVPIWINVGSKAEVSIILLKIAEESPVELLKLLTQYLIGKQAVQNFHRIVGRPTLERILKIVQPRPFGHVLSTVNSLTKIHKSFGNTDAISDYFLSSYLSQYFKFGTALEHLVTAAVLDYFIVDFGLSITDYRTFLQKSKSKIAKLYLEQNQVDSPIDNIASAKLYQIDLLIHLVLENKRPWWEKEFDDFVDQSIKKQIKELTHKLLEQDTVGMITVMMQKPAKEKILQNLLPILTPQEFDKVILALNPDFGGFIISFNLLLFRTRTPLNKANWFAFIVQWLAKNEDFNASKFVEEAFVRLSSLVNRNQLQLKADLSETARNAIKDGEMRFLPFIDLLGSPSVKKKEKNNIEISDITLEESQSIAFTDDLYPIELLIYLSLENKMPSWAKMNDIKSRKTVDKQLFELTKNLIERKPKELVNRIVEKPAYEKILQRLLPMISTQQFDKLLLALTPDFAGFIMSFNLLLWKTKPKTNQSSWHIFLLQYISDTDSFNANNFLEQAVTKFSSIVNINERKLIEKLMDKAKKAIEADEKRFLPFIDLLGNILSRKKKQKQLDSGLPLSIDTRTYGLIDTVVYYLRMGSIPQETSFHISGYFDLVNYMERQIRFGHHDLRLAIVKALSEEKTRSRLVQREKLHFLLLVTKILFPADFEDLLVYKTKILQLLKQNWPEVSYAVLNEIFFLKVFEHLIENQSMSISAENLISSFIQFASIRLNRAFQFERTELEKTGFSNNLINALIPSDNSSEKDNDIQDPKTKLAQLESLEDQLVDHRILVKNAGLVITWPYLTRYFDLLEMTEKGKFKSDKEAIRAVHLLQFIATGSTLAPEHELLLNKVLCGLKIATPVPKEVELTEKEIKTTEMMMKGLLQNWDKIKSSSIEALREGFLSRDGYILEKEKTWELKVEKKTIDILMESMPWGFGTIKLSWMEKRLNVEWL
jgi:hypothetical protein